ncbi:hypothetical protein J4474_00400 [Candidatus Pacearchaeota archaeon]|nr:hypothetical protein [Candidatus Pacearchaeota archaeon]
MKSLIDELKKTGIGVIGTILVGGFLTLEVLGLNSFENFTYRFNCGERIKYYYKQEPQNFCEDSCVAEKLFRLTDIYDGKIELNQAYEIAKKRCETKK